jgi:hypothetical protein
MIGAALKLIACLELPSFNLLLEAAAGGVRWMQETKTGVAVAVATWRTKRKEY